MSYFARSAFNSIVEKVNRLRRGEFTGRRILVTTTSFPMEVSLDLAKLLDGYFTKNEDLELTYKIAKVLWKQWKEPEGEFQEQWLDKTGNFAGYRNASPPDAPGKIGLVVLVGADQIVDSASLADFFRLSPETVWHEELKESFAPWVEARLEGAKVGFDDKTVQTFNNVLLSLKDEGCADLFQIDRLLRETPIEDFGAQDGKDALKIFLKGFEKIHLPSFVGYMKLRKGAKTLNPYIEHALRFFRYDLFMEETQKKGILNNIEALIEEEKGKIDENRYFDFDERGAFESDREFIEAVKTYITEEDQKAKQILYQSDFIAIHDKIMKFKPKKNAPPQERTTKLSGGPIEVILSALWQTMKDFKKNHKRALAGELSKIEICGKAFRYDEVTLGEGEIETKAEKQEIAQEYLERLLGGVDYFFDGGGCQEKSYLDTSSFGSEVKLDSSLLNGEIRFLDARTAEPSFEFSITLEDTQNGRQKKDFAWRLPMTHSFRISQELVTWASEAFEKLNQKYVLPAFHIPYHEEIMRASNEDETRRVLLQAIHQMSDEMTNLLTEEWDKHGDPLFPYLRDLSIAYRKILDKAKRKGIFSVFHKEENENISPWETLRKQYEKAAGAFLGDDEDCQNSQMAPVLMRAFLFIKQRKHESLEWVTNPHESSGIATILHPAVIEMMLAQTTYLFTCFKYAAAKEWGSKNASSSFKEEVWQDYIDLSVIQMPLGGLIFDENKTLSTDIQGSEFIHRIGKPSGEETPLTTRLLLRYETYDDENTSDSELFANSRESRLLSNIMKNYCRIHPHAHDGISLAFYWNKDIQPIISAVDSYLKNLAQEDNWGEKEKKAYSISICLLSESAEESGIKQWIEEWKERWDAAETEAKYAFYKNCRFSVSHRVISLDKDKNTKDFAKLIKESLDVDIVFLYDFIGAFDKGNDFERVAPYDKRQRTLHFPIMEKPFCTLDDPDNKLKRARVISNPQFAVSSLHLETMARIKHPTIPANEEHVLVGYGDFQPWVEIVNEAHKKAEWVVCIDPSIDDQLIRYRGAGGTSQERDIIGFGSGVGLHGELNYTISTEQLGLSDIKYRLTRAISDVYQTWNESQRELVAKSVIREAQRLSGLSLVRATGIDEYVRDFMAYSLARKILSDGEDLLCDELITLDAYQHWFSGSDTSEEKMRPDLLWVKARLEDDGRVAVDMHLIECKTANENTSHLEKAVKQINNGLRSLVPSFKPKQQHSHDDLRPDQRYWWLQLHRLIASKTRINKQRQQVIMAALERLSNGDYTISWRAAVLAFWTDSDKEYIEKIGSEVFYDEKVGRLEYDLFAAGREAVYSLCAGDKSLNLPWNEEPIIYGEKKSTGEKVSKPELTPEPVLEPEPQPQPEPAPTVIVKPEVQKKRIPERILLGTTVRGGREVYWEFGHPKLPNRHLLIFGTSGMGKTYAIQCLLCELGLQGQNSLVMDYTKGFTKKQLEQETQQILAPKQHVLVQQPLPINPFKIQQQIIDDEIEGIFENPVTAAKRIAGIFTEIYGTLGDQQYSVLFDAIHELIEKREENATLNELLEILESYVDDGRHQKGYVTSTISKIKPFVLANPFSASGKIFNWESIFGSEQNRCHVFQFAGLDQESSRLVIEFTLWDLYSYVGGTGSKDQPKVLVLDEAQNLDLTEGAPVTKYLREGRKFGLSLILATQIIRGLSSDKQSRLFQAGHKLFFRPSDTECLIYAKLIANSIGGNVDEWVTELSSLTKGQCYSLGESLNTATGMLEMKAFKINVTALNERIYKDE